MKIYINLESTPSGKTMIHLRDYPGCNIKGITPDDAMERLPAGVDSYMQWRLTHNLDIPSEPYEFLIEEKARGGPFNPGNKAAFFKCDEKPVTEEERRNYLNLMAISRQDLLQIVSNLTPEQLGLWVDSEKWTIKEILRHLASAERFYITRLFEKDELPRSKPSRNVIERIKYMREFSVETLKGMDSEKLSLKTFRGGEFWTARKVFRRFLEHEREHTGQILRILRYHYHCSKEELTFSLSEFSRLFEGISWKE